MTPLNRLIARVARCRPSAARLPCCASVCRAAWSVAVLTLASNVARATIVEPRDLAELVGEAEYVGSVWIEQSTSLSDDPTLKYPACGASYTARTVEVVKGAAGRVRFHASEDLVVGREYLVLLVQGLRSTTALVSTTSLTGTTSPLETKQRYRDDCTRRHPGLWSMEGAATPLLDRRLKIESRDHPGDRWVWQAYFLRDIADVRQLDERVVSTVLMSANPTPYPTGAYLSWQGVHDALRRATSGKAERTRAK